MGCGRLLRGSCLPFFAVMPSYVAGLPQTVASMDYGSSTGGRGSTSTPYTAVPLTHGFELQTKLSIVGMVTYSGNAPSSLAGTAASLGFGFGKTKQWIVSPISKFALHAPP